jgi:hypothetical protein
MTVPDIVRVLRRKPLALIGLIALVLTLYWLGLSDRCDEPILVGHSMGGFPLYGCPSHSLK